MHHDAMLIVRSAMIRRIDEIAANKGRLSLAHLCDHIDSIRHDARVHGLEPVERIASMLESALALGGVGPVILTYLDLMRDAVACEDDSSVASDAYAAHLSLRLGC